jgi:hypothetical protein
MTASGTPFPTPPKTIPPVKMTQVQGPRVGGGQDGETWWTGGSNVTSKRRIAPKDTAARRPDSFRSADSVAKQCKEGLPTTHHLGKEGEKDYTISLVTWIAAIQGYMVEKGMDTVFYIYDPIHDQEVNMFEQWGVVTKEQVKEWVKTLKEGVPDTSDPTQKLPACPYDETNLLWSGKAIVNSVSMQLWSQFEQDLSLDASGPEVFMAVVHKKQVTTSTTTRTLIRELEDMKLTNVPGHNVIEHARAVVDKGKTIAGTGNAPSDLSTLIVRSFMGTDELPFELEAATAYNKLDRDPTCLDWQEVVEQLKTKYVSMTASNQWKAKVTQKKQPDELAAMKAALNKLTQKLSSNSGNGNGSGGNNNGNGGRDLSKVKCRGCGKFGHMVRNCPEKDKNKDTNPGNGNDSGTKGKWARPKEGESEIKEIDGETHKFCKKCRPRWRKGPKAHTTAEHKTRAELAGQDNSGAGGNDSQVAGGLAQASQPPPNIGGLRLMGGLMLCQAIQDQAQVDPPTIEDDDADDALSYATAFDDADDEEDDPLNFQAGWIRS